MNENETFNYYLTMAINQGWSDPIAFANRRMAEVEQERERERERNRKPDND